MNCKSYKLVNDRLLYIDHNFQINYFALTILKSAILMISFLNALLYKFIVPIECEAQLQIH
jgi:hypothetical protein